MGHNINNYYLCKVKSFGDKHLTKDEIDDFHLSTLKLRYDEALAEYDSCRCTSLGRLIANREVPVLKRAKELLQKIRVLQKFEGEYEITEQELEKVTTDSGKELELQGYIMKVRE